LDARSVQPMATADQPPINTNETPDMPCLGNVTMTVTQTQRAS
jgi:hypothetical protein